MASTDSTASTSEFYNPWAEHSQEDIANVKRWEDEEQQRRIADTLGEQQRRNVAQQVSEIVSTTLRPNWFQQGTGYVFNILKLAREAGDKVLNSSQIRALNAKIQIVGQRGAATAQDVTNRVGVAAQGTTQDAKAKIQETANDVKLKLQETSNDMKLKLQETTQDVKTKLQETTQNMGAKIQETSSDVKLKLQEKLGTAQGVAQQQFDKLQVVANEGLEKAQEASKEGIEKVSTMAKMVKSASLQFIGRIKRALSNLAENSNLAFAVLEEEGERAWRLGSDNEVYAILNALRVSSLFKDMAPAFYRPTFEPTRKYSTRLLEENERARRVFVDISDRTAVNNAKAVSGLIADKFSTATPASATIAQAPMPAKVEIAEETKVQTPMSAAM